MLFLKKEMVVNLVNTGVKYNWIPFSLKYNNWMVITFIILKIVLFYTWNQIFQLIFDKLKLQKEKNEPWFGFFIV